MAIEIERKFLVINDNWRNEVNKKYTIKQGYLSSVPERTVRVRTKNEKGFITIKGASENITRIEFEYEIPLLDAAKLLSLCELPIIEKIRYEIDFEGKSWEVDEFWGANKGLIVAELELYSEQEKFVIPEWIGLEVSNDPRFYNSHLVQKPYSLWE